jgi:hypothetical protein
MEDLPALVDIGLTWDNLLRVRFFFSRRADGDRPLAGTEAGSNSSGVDASSVCDRLRDRSNPDRLVDLLRVSRG